MFFLGVERNSFALAPVPGIKVKVVFVGGQPLVEGVCVLLGSVVLKTTSASLPTLHHPNV